MASSFPTVAHLLRPAQGGMRELVRALLLAAPTDAPPLLLAPPDTLPALCDAVPDESRRTTLQIDTTAPHHQLAGGQIAGRWAKNRGATLLHGHGLRYAPLFASASLTSGIPLIVSLHNLVPDNLTGLQKMTARTALARATTIIAVSDAVAKSALAVTDAERIVTIPNGVETARFAVGSAERSARRNALREAWGVAPGAPIIVCVSRLSPEKDVANLLEAFALTVADFPNARLFVAGEGKTRQTLAWHIELLGIGESATLLGAVPREKIADLLFAADIFALASREEGLSLAVLEAMAAGLPVVVTDVGGLPEAVIHNATGLLAPPHDPKAFADGMAQWLADTQKRKRFGDAGSNRVVERFTQARMITETFALYERVIHRQ